jgi:hypothetical protein
MLGIAGLVFALSVLFFFAWVDVKIGATKPWWN